jgi:hypothetical protein
MDNSTVTLDDSGPGSVCLLRNISLNNKCIQSRPVFPYSVSSANSIVDYEPFEIMGVSYLAVTYGNTTLNVYRMDDVKGRFAWLSDITLQASKSSISTYVSNQNTYLAAGSNNTNKIDIYGWGGSNFMTPASTLTIPNKNSKTCNLQYVGCFVTHNKKHWIGVVDTCSRLMMFDTSSLSATPTKYAFGGSRLDGIIMNSASSFVYAVDSPTSIVYCKYDNAGWSCNTGTIHQIFDLSTTVTYQVGSRLVAIYTPSAQAYFAVAASPCAVLFSPFQFQLPRYCFGEATQHIAYTEVKSIGIICLQSKAATKMYKWDFMNAPTLIESVFPGLDLLDMAFVTVGRVSVLTTSSAAGIVVYPLSTLVTTRVDTRSVASLGIQGFFVCASSCPPASTLLNVTLSETNTQCNASFSRMLTAPSVLSWACNITYPSNKAVDRFAVLLTGTSAMLNMSIADIRGSIALHNATNSTDMTAVVIATNVSSTEIRVECFTLDAWTSFWRLEARVVNQPCDLVVHNRVLPVITLTCAFPVYWRVSLELHLGDQVWTVGVVGIAAPTNIRGSPVVQWRKPFSICAVGMGQQEIHTVVLAQGQFNCSCKVELSSTDCLNLTLMVPLPIGAENGAVCTLSVLTASGHTYLLALDVQLAYVRPSLTADWPTSAPISFSSTVLQQWRLPERRPELSDWDSSSGGTPPASDVESITDATGSCEPVGYTGMWAFICAVSKTPPSRKVQTVLSKSFELTGFLPNSSALSIAAATPSVWVNQRGYIDNISIIFNTEYVNPLDFANSTIEGLGACGTLVAARNNTLICGNIQQVKTPLNKSAAISFTWNSGRSANSAVLSVVTRPIILAVLPASLSAAGEWIVVAGTDMAADTSSLVPIVKVAAITCGNCSFVHPNSPHAIQCLTPVQLPDPTVSAVEVVVERAGVQSAPRILNYPPKVSAAWNTSTVRHLTLEHNMLTVTPEPMLVLHMKGNATVHCFIKASAPRCNAMLQGQRAVSQASLRGSLEQQVTTSGNGGASLIITDVQLVVASACNISLIASCQDSKGGSAESGPLPLATPSFSFEWYNISNSTGALLDVLHGIGVQVTTAQDDGWSLDAMSCVLTISRLGADSPVVLASCTVAHLNTTASVIITYNTDSVALDFGEKYALSSTCTWLPSAEQFILDDVRISTVDVALTLTGASQLEAYKFSSLHAVLVSTPAADFHSTSITCSLRLLSDSSLSTSLMSVATSSRNYSVLPGGALQQDVAVGFESMSDLQNATVALYCVLNGRSIASNTLVVQVVQPALIILHNILGSAIWASSVNEDVNNTYPTGTAFTITITISTVPPLRCQPVLNPESYTSGDQAGSSVAKASSLPSLLSRSGIHAANASNTSVLTVTLPAFGIFAGSGSEITLAVECTDGVDRTLSALVGTFQVARPQPQWLVWGENVLFQPDLHTSITGQLASVPSATISATMLVNQVDEQDAVWFCVAFLQPVDELITTSSVLQATSKTLQKILVDIDAHTMDSWSISVNFTCPACLMGNMYTLQTECTYAATSEGVRFPPLNLSTPSVVLAWAMETVSRVSGVVVVPDGIGEVEGIISIGSTDQCPLVTIEAWKCEVLAVAADFAVSSTNISDTACFRSESQVPEGCHAHFQIPALPSCALGQRFDLYVMCRRASLDASQYWLSRPLPFSTPLVSIAWDTSTSLVHAGEQHEVNLTCSAAGGIPLSVNVSCGIYVFSGKVELISQTQVGQFDQTTSAKIVKMHFSIVGASRTVFQLQASCSLWQTSITSNLLQLIVASYSIRLLSHPAVYVPSDRSQVWPATPLLKVAVVDDVNRFMPDAWCSATSTTTEIIPVPGHDVNSVRTNKVNSTFDFPPFGFKSSFADSAVEVIVSCNVPSLLPVPDMHFTVLLDPISTSALSLSGGTRRPGLVAPPIAIVVMRNASALAVPSINVTTCASNLESNEMLPPISCRLSCKDNNSSCALVSLENTLAMIGGSMHTGTFSGFSINAPQDATFLLQLSCSIGSITMPGPPPTQVHIQGCGSGSHPVGVYCSACESNTYSYGGDNATCQRCPDNGALCTDGNVRLLPNFYRSGNRGERIESSTRLYPCLNAEACVVNSSTQEYSCAVGYAGPVCSLCDINANFAMFGGFCRECWSPGLIGIFCVVLFAALLGLVAFATFSNHRFNEATVAVLRILLGYVQTVGSLSMMKAGGTRSYHDVLGWTQVVAIYPLSIGALQCIWEPSYLIRFVLTVLLPMLTAVAGVAMFVVWVCSKRCFCPSPEIVFPAMIAVAQQTKSTSNPQSSSLRTAIKKNHQLWAIFWVAMCVMYMPITSAAIRVFDCYYPDIDGVYYLRQDMRVPCYTAEHFMVRTMAIAILAVVTCGFPLFVTWSLGRVPHDSTKYARQIAIWRFVSAGLKRLPIQNNARKVSEIILSTRKRSFADVSAAILRGISVIKGNFQQGHISWWHSTELVRQSGMIFLIFVIANPYVQATGASAWTLIFLLLHMKTWAYRSFVLNLCQFLNLASSLCVSLLCTALLQYDVTSAEMVSQTAADMSFYSWFVTTALTTVSLGTLAILGLMGVILQFAVVAQRMNLSNLHATHRRFSSLGMARASSRRMSRIPTSERITVTPKSQQPGQ